MLTVAVRALRATTVRSLALAATGAIAVFGCVAAEDAHNDLLHGLYRDYSEYVSTADMWVVNGNDELATEQLRSPADFRLASPRSPASPAVRAYRGGFMDFGGRRVWIIARAAATPTPIPPNQARRRQHRHRRRAPAPGRMDNRVPAGSPKPTTSSWAARSSCPRQQARSPTASPRPRPTSGGAPARSS